MVVQRDGLAVGEEEVVVARLNSLVSYPYEIIFYTVSSTGKTKYQFASYTVVRLLGLHFIASNNIIS